MRNALLADRLRVEERLLIDAFAQRGHEATLVAPSRIHLALTHLVSVPACSPMGADWPEPSLPALALNRGPATPERTTLAALLSAQGTIVVNRPATARLLADRLARVRHLALSSIPIPETLISFGEEATFAAIEELGYPVLLKPVLSDLVMPDALVEDRDAAEAVVEHRTMLGAETTVLVQRFVASDESIRLVIVGRDLVGIEIRHRSGGWRPSRDSAYQPYQGNTDALRSLANRMIERFGSGVYSVEVVKTDNGPIVVGAENLVNFRSLVEQGVDMGGMIADFALAQLANKDNENEASERGG
jgi:[lysine-biosynthesis-protein LysW]--L-2-aminoadipate ligase